MHGPVTPDTCTTRPGISAPSALVSDYREGSPFFFASSEESLLAQAEHVASYLVESSDGRLVQTVQNRLLALEMETSGSVRVALALPFLEGEPARGWLLRKVESARGRASVPTTRERAVLESQAGFSLSFSPTPSGYMEAVESALGSISRAELEKVVLGRTLELSFQGKVDCVEWLRRFYAQNLAGYVFALDLAPPGAPMHKLMGASPELLLQKRGARVLTNPLAGSRPRAGGAVQDEDNARALLGSDKDRREHALVVDAVASALTPHCVQLDVPRQPSLLATPTMWHLSTVISGQLKDPRCSSLELVRALHPTPAVSGWPQAAATQLLGRLEGKSRGPFGGVVGHCDAAGDGEWAVTLRCAELTATSATLFAGAGVVAGSDPRAELDETGAKFRTALRALGVPLLSGAS